MVTTCGQSLIIKSFDGSTKDLDMHVGHGGEIPSAMQSFGFRMSLQILFYQANG